jgi:hypothetical protein
MRLALGFCKQLTDRRNEIIGTRNSLFNFHRQAFAGGAELAAQVNFWLNKIKHNLAKVIKDGFI